MRLLSITRFTFQEVLRRRLFLAVVLLSMLLLVAYALLLRAVVASYIPQMASEGFSVQLALLAGGMFISVPSIWLVYLLSGILAIFLTAGMVSSETEAGTFSIIVSKPLQRYEIIAGKWLGYVLILGGYLALLYLSFLGIIYWVTGYWPDQAWSALGALEMAVLVLLGLTTLGSALFPTLVNGAIMLILFISAPLTNFISTFVQIITTTSQTGTLAPPSETVQNLIAVTNLIIPTDALWHQAAAYLVPVDALNLLATQSFSASTFNIPLINPQDMTSALFIWIICYCLVLPTLAMWRFSRRDL